jgi:hypothetical protein
MKRNNKERHKQTGQQIVNMLHCTATFLRNIYPSPHADFYFMKNKISRTLFLLSKNPAVSEGRPDGIF